MRRVLIVACMAAMTLMAASAFAGTQDAAVVALHMDPHPLKGNIACPDPWTVDCNDFVTTWPTFSSADIFLVVAKGNAAAGVGALSCGVEYGANLGMFGWTLCTSGLEFVNDGGNGDWPASLGGNRITWDVSVDCQNTVIGTNGVHALAGSFYVYAYGPDLFQITPNNNLQSGIPEFQVGDCSNAVSNLLYPEAAGMVGFGGTEGYNPCTFVVPTQPKTWGQIKTQY